MPGDLLPDAKHAHGSVMFQDAQRDSTPRIMPVSRERDEELLDWLACFEGGESAYSIAKRCGKNPGVVLRAIKKVYAEEVA